MTLTRLAAGLAMAFALVVSAHAAQPNQPTSPQAPAAQKQQIEGEGDSAGPARFKQQVGESEGGDRLDQFTRSGGKDLQ